MPRWNQTHELTLHYEVINNEEKFSDLEGTVIFMPELKCRLLIPQYHLMELQRLNNPEVSFTMTWYKSVLELSYQVPITIHYEQIAHIPVLHIYKRIYNTVDSLAMTVCVASEKN